MADTTLKTRIKLKYDTYDNWIAKDPILLAGEMAVTTVATTPTKDVDSVSAPQVLIKVGDGSKKYSLLPWASGLAADVYEWAKASVKPSYNKSEVGLGNVDNVKQFSASNLPTIGQVSGLTTRLSGIDSAISGKADAGHNHDKTYLGINAKAADSEKLDNHDSTYFATATAVSDAQSKADSAYNLANGKQSPATTLAGYGITDAKIANGVITLGANTITPITDVSGKADVSTVSALSGRVDTAEDDIDTLQGYFSNSIAKKATADASGNVITSTYATKGELSSGLSTKLGVSAKAADSSKLEGKTKAEVISEARTGYATTTYVDNKVAGSVQYLGLASKLSDLSTSAGKGDFYRASATFEGADSGDLLIALKDNPKQLINDVDYAVVKSTDDYKGTVKSVTITGANGIGVTGSPITESGTIALIHNGGSAMNKDSGFYKFSTDNGSHVASVTAVGSSDITGALGFTPYNATNPNGYTNNKGTVTNIATGDGLSGGPITSTGTISLKKSTSTEIGGGKATPTNAAMPSGKNYEVKIDNTGKYFVAVPWENSTYTVNNGTFTVSGGNGLTGSGSSTANQAGATSATLAVGQGTGITVNTDNVAVTDYNNLLTAKGDTLKTEGGNTIIFDCGGATL